MVFKQSLKARDHKVNIRDLNSGLHAFLIKAGTLIGAADPRREGIVMGEYSELEWRSPRRYYLVIITES